MVVVKLLVGARPGNSLDAVRRTFEVGGRPSGGRAAGAGGGTKTSRSVHALAADSTNVRLSAQNVASVGVASSPM